MTSETAIPDLKRRVVICADDYGLSPGVSRGIRELLAADRLSATSCMVVYPEFEADGPLLAPWFGKADIGLHFTLTEDRTATSLMREAYFGRLDERAVEAKLESQLAVFAAIVGQPPDYIDGHQHVHLLPGVRDAVLRAAQRIGAYVRSTREPVGAAMAGRPSPVEAAFLSLTARPLQARADRLGVATNRGFRGVRTFRETRPYRGLFKRMIAGAREGSLIMCHPGFADDVLTGRDAITGPREDEVRYFLSREFCNDFGSEGLEVSRLGDAIRAIV